MVKDQTEKTFEVLKADSSIYEHVFCIWGDRLKSSKTFGEEKDEDNWQIDFDNSQKVLDGLQIQDSMTKADLE